MEVLEFGLLCFTSLFTMVNPMGVVPIYIGLTTGLSPDASKKTAKKAVLVSFIILVLFAVMGQLIFKFFSISANGFRVVGGVIFFIMGFDMLQARLARSKSVDESVQQYTSDIAITPVAIPMICGPGTITVIILLMQDASTLMHKGILFLVLTVVLVITLVFLLTANKITKFMGEQGNKVMLRLMGLIVMVIAVEFFFAGLKPIIRDILNIK